MCVNWLCSEKADLTEETLEKQYELVRKRTSNNYTYNMGSHVLQFGSLSIDEEPAADYLGELNTGCAAGDSMLQFREETKFSGWHGCFLA